MHDDDGPDLPSEASAPASEAKRRRPFLTTHSPRAAALMMVVYIVLGAGQAFLARSNSLLWLRVGLAAGFLLLAAGHALTLIRLRRRPELVKPYRG